jgi:organic radical activating enzyme
MYTLDFCEVYITNVCNLNCTHCNRFNNFAFAGHSRWEDYQHDYQQWAKKVNFNSISILGGEPLSNPDFLNWMHGIATVWNSAEISILTNGTQLDRWPSLYKEIKKYNGRVTVVISEHSPQHWLDAIGNVKNFLQGTIENQEHKTWKQSYDSIKDSSWPDCNTPDDFYTLPEHIQTECQTVFNIHPTNNEFSATSERVHFYKDSNNVKILLEPSWMFKPNALIYQSTNQIDLYNSDPEKAIKACTMKKCPQFSRGKLYKCPPVTVLGDFIQQFSINVSDADKQLIDAYKPASHCWPDDQLKKFLDDLTDLKTIPQCKFCPEELPFIKFSAGTKKIKLLKKQNLS